MIRTHENLSIDIEIVFLKREIVSHATKDEHNQKEDNQYACSFVVLQSIIVMTGTAAATAVSIYKETQAALNYSYLCDSR